MLFSLAFKILRLDCRIPVLLSISSLKKLLLQSSSCVQIPLTLSCSHVVTITRFRMQIIVCSICHASVGAYGALAVIKFVFDDFSAFVSLNCLERKLGRRSLIPKLN